MKTAPRNAITLALLLALTGPLLAADSTPAGRIDFGPIPAAEGAEFVEVNIRQNLISMVARLAEKEEPEVANMIRGIQQIRVNVLGLTDANRAEVEQRVKTVRSQLDAAGWERIVTAKQEKADVGVFVKTRGDEAIEGVVVTIINDNRQAVLVNVVGDFKPEKLALIGERFNVQPLKELGLEPHPKH